MYRWSGRGALRLKIIDSSRDTIKIRLIDLITGRIEYESATYQDVAKAIVASDGYHSLAIYSIRKGNVGELQNVLCHIQLFQIDHSDTLWAYVISDLVHSGTYSLVDPIGKMARRDLQSIIHA